MYKVSRFSFLFAVTALLLTTSLFAEDGINGSLVTTQWLEKNLHNPDLVLLDASPAPKYAANHIPGAVRVEIYSFAIQDLSNAQMEKIFQSWGVSPGKKVVIYDEGSMNAARLFYSLYYHGFPAENMYLLDGGITKWESERLPVTKDPTPPPAAGNFQVTSIRQDQRVRLPEVLTAAGDTHNYALVEALGPDWHFGDLLVMQKAGHIPNGILLPGEDFYNPDKTFKSPQEIKKMLDYVGIRPDQQIDTYCGGGVAAAIPYFAIKFIAKYPKVSLYKESELGWLSDERELPYWTYDVPSLLRDAEWLKFWNGQQIRMFKGTTVSVVDVRSADAFNQGHLPFALNIPADVFKSNLNDPAALAKILGDHGVNASLEAVVVSGAGLTKESALAFLALDKLGQKRVSILADSLDTWSKRGFPTTKDPTAVGTPKPGPSAVIPITNYPAAFRDGVIIPDPTVTHGLYPKVFIASGKDVPTKTPEGKVVHVAYTDLLNSDGTPKPAKDIWKTLDKAGVPRYAEIVCFSDDPSEAAVNYFILKLMGYPDIKVRTM